MATRLPLLFLKVVRWTFRERSFSSFSFKDSKIFSSSQTRALCKNIKKKNPSAFSVAQVMTMRSKQRIASEILNHSWIMNTWHTNGKLMNLAILLEKASRPSQRIENSSYRFRKSEQIMNDKRKIVVTERRNQFQRKSKRKTEHRMFQDQCRRWRSWFAPQLELMVRVEWKHLLTNAGSKKIFLSCFLESFSALDVALLAAHQQPHIT